MSKNDPQPKCLIYVFISWQSLVYFAKSQRRSPFGRMGTFKHSQLHTTFLYSSGVRNTKAINITLGGDLRSMYQTPSGWVEGRGEAREVNMVAFQVRPPLSDLPPQLVARSNLERRATGHTATESHRPKCAYREPPSSPLLFSLRPREAGQTRTTVRGLPWRTSRLLRISPKRGTSPFRSRTKRPCICSGWGGNPCESSAMKTVEEPPMHGFKKTSPFGTDRVRGALVCAAPVRTCTLTESFSAWDDQAQCARTDREGMPTQPLCNAAQNVPATITSELGIHDNELHGDLISEWDNLQPHPVHLYTKKAPPNSMVPPP